eukprot:5409865-Pleurochrysis_carterae.AAC.1
MRRRAVRRAPRSRVVSRATKSRAKWGATGRKKRCKKRSVRRSMAMLELKRLLRIHKKEGNKRSLSA